MTALTRLLAIFFFLSGVIGCTNPRKPTEKNQSMSTVILMPTSTTNPTTTNVVRWNNIQQPTDNPVATMKPSSEPISTLMPKTFNEARWDIYHSDPQHLWNRLFRQLYGRTAQDGTQYGWNSLDPLLWYETTHLLEETSHEQTIQLLDEFLSTNGEELITDPLKRAMFLRDLWTVFDWLTIRAEGYSEQRQALQSRLAQVMQRLALTDQEILSLPDNYGMAVRSKEFPATYQMDNPDVAFLPTDLLTPDSDWICLGRDGGPIAMSHTEAFPFFGRSVFLVFIRVPEGRAATLDFLRELNPEGQPAPLPIGAEVALVRRMLLIDDNGTMTLSPVVESVQIRHFSPAQNYYEFRLNRFLLFNRMSGGLHISDKEFILFQSHAIDLFELDHISEVQIPEFCTGCHGGEVYGTQSVISYSRARFPLSDKKQPVLSETTPEIEAQTVITWKLNHQTWQSLKALWR